MMEVLPVKIKEKMAEHSLSTYVLEKRAGLKQGAVQNILYGRSKNPSISIVRAIAQVFNCSIEDLVDNKLQPQELLDMEKDTSSPPSSTVPFHNKEDTYWNQELYLLCFKAVHDIISSKKITVEKRKILDIVEEIYNYSYYNNLLTPDIHFSNWLIEKNQLK